MYRAQWFDKFGKCSCGRRAQGILMSFTNERMGEFCERCAKREIKDGQRQRRQDDPAIVKALA